MGKTSSYQAPQLQSTASGGAQGTGQLTPQQQQQISAISQMNVPGGLNNQLAQQLQSQFQSQDSGPETVNPFTSQMVTDSQAQANSAIGNQQNFVNALQAQNGIANQSSVFGQQQGLANQLQAETQGAGPNPAQAQLAQNTAANTANQAALMAGQRGAGSNAGLIARQAGMQGAANQQNAVGQAATLQAQQQLAAQSQLAAQQQALGQTAGTQVGNLANANSALTSASLQNQAQQIGALQNQNAQIGGYQQNANSLNQQTQAQNAANKNSFVGNIIGAGTGALSAGLSGGLKGGASAAAGAGGGGSPSALGNYGTPSGGGNIFGVNTSFAKGGEVKDEGSVHPIITILEGYAKGGPVKMAKGGKVPALVSPGERYLPPSEVEKVVRGKKEPMKAGEKIPGKPKVSGAKNSYANDTVPKTLEEGGVVLPRSVTQAKNPHSAAHRFISALMAKNNGRLK
jgi:hypothetical protein